MKRRRNIAASIVLLASLIFAGTASGEAVGTYNVEHGHPVQNHVTMILRDANKYDLSVLGLGETQDYAPALRRAAPADDYRLIGSDNALLVKRGLPVGARGSFRPAGSWFTTRGRVHRQTPVTWARVKGITYAAIHAPVHAWVATRYGRKFIGPARRRAAYRFFVQRVIRFARWHNHRPLVIMGDWNANPDTRGLYSPNYLRRKIGGHYLRPHTSTGHGEIDFAIARGIRGANVHVRPNLRVAQSDHRLVTFKVGG